MPTITATPNTLSAHTFFSAYNNRAGSSATDFSTDLSNYFTHFDATQRRATGIIFKVDNVPQGSVLNSVHLRLRYNNGFTAAAANSRYYLCVENNLDPNGSGAVTNGTLGSQPWQRIGRQSAATTLLGVRCGPTHSGDLSTVGRTPRDTQAYVYKTFVSDADQATASAITYAASNGTWANTCDFTDGLQALINDTGWNGTTQYVLVWLFGDGNTGTEYNIGSLASISWASGTVGSSNSYANSSAAQLYTNTYPPEMVLDYTTESLKCVNSKSISSGQVRLGPANVWGRWRGERVELGVGNPVIPGWSAGAHDLPPTHASGISNPLDPSWGITSGNPLAARLRADTQRPGRVDGRCILVDDFLGATPAFWWEVDQWQDDWSPLETYSGRFYHRYDQDAIVGNNSLVCSFDSWNGSAWVSNWKIEHKQLVIDIFNGDTYSELRAIGPGDTGAWSSYKFVPPASGSYYRYEIQVSSAMTPKVRVRVYLDDSTTALWTTTINPTNVTCDRVIFKDEIGGTYLFHFRVADAEFWTDYTMGRQYPEDTANAVGTPYVPQKWEWFEWDGTNAVPLEDLGTITSVAGDGSSPVLDASKAMSTEDYIGTIWTGTGNPWASKTTYTYATNRQYDLYLPPGTAPADGWPILFYNHGGFWVSGDKGAIQLAFIQWAMANGFAVASGGYVLGQVTFSAYPAWNPASPTGRYPTFILDYKAFARHVQDRARVTGDGTYPVDGSRGAAIGHSAGGYNALAAVTSRELDSDGGGRSLRLANSGNISAFGTPNLADPTFKLCAVFAAPVNLSQLRLWDRTHPDYPYAGSGQGIIRATGELFMGRPISSTTGTANTGCDEFVRLNPTRQVPTYYAWGGHDFLVASHPAAGAYAQGPLLADAWADEAASIPSTSTLTVVEYPDALHHTIDGDDLDFDHFYRWLRANL